METLGIISLLLYTFGVYAFGTMTVYTVRQYGRPGWSCPAVDAADHGSRESRFIGGTIIIFCFVWFVLALAMTLASLHPGDLADRLQLFQAMMSLMFSPLIMHVVYADCRHAVSRLPSPVWKGLIWATYGVSGLLAVWLPAVVFDVIPRWGIRIGPVLNFSIGGLFTLTAIYSVLLMRASRTTETTDQRATRRGMSGLFLLLIVLSVLMIVNAMSDIGLGRMFQVIASTLPLAFIFVGTYHENRFEFFDLFIKRGLSLLLTIILLTAYFGLVLPRLENLALGWARPWVYGVVLLPVAMSLPWLYRRLGALLDRWWLGRTYTIVEAVKLFLSGLQSATDEQELIEQGEKGLGTIFRAPVRIHLELREEPSAGFDYVLDVPIRSSGQRVGAVLLGSRASQAPYFSEDAALAASLADVFAYMLENVRLQQKKSEQDKLAKELSLQASRSELKALRAQINPHFLFNALNAIAGLIHKDPLRADNTVEQLAEVFRYTLSGSEKEWALLEDEMDFVRAYLDVEQARFGERLQVRISIEDGITSVRIPTMMIQTLVENAVKHGVGSVRGTARIEIDARRDGDGLLIEVADNGPGFAKQSAPGSVPRKGGYGLKNIRQRLEGSFGDRARLSYRRDEARDMTVVSITMPHDPQSRSSGAASA